MLRLLCGVHVALFTDLSHSAVAPSAYDRDLAVRRIHSMDAHSQVAEQPAAIGAAEHAAAIGQYDDTCDTSGGITCYVCNTFVATDWASLMIHMKQKHKILVSSLHGSYLYSKAKEIIRAQDRDRYAANRIDNKKQATASAISSASKGKPTSAAAGRTDQAPPTAGGAPTMSEETGAYAVHVDESGGVWKAHWVRTGHDGLPTEPLMMMPLLQADEPLTWVADSGLGGGASVTSAGAALGSVPQPAPTEPPLDPSDWTSTLPVVSVKAMYKDVVPPAPSSFGTRASGWPVPFNDFTIELPDFRKFLANEKAIAKVAQSDCFRGLTRFWHMLQTPDGKDLDECMIADPKLLASLYVGDVHKAVFELKLLSPEYSWTRKVIEALKHFCAWQKGIAAKRQLISSDPSWLKVSTAIDQLTDALKGGIAKAALANIKSRAQQRRVGDAEKLAAFPSVVDMKAATLKAMHTLSYISSMYAESVCMPREVQSAATAAMVGILYLNGFGGRKLEWELMTRKHVLDQMDAGLDFVLCPKHKTSHIYGTLAKWLAPGTVHALRAYLRLPRKITTLTLLSPCDDGIDTIDLSYYFRKFCSTYFKSSCAHPTVNLMRKYYHTELARMTKSEDTLLQIFKAIDAHSAEVAKRHYILKTPSDDAKLAKALVYSLLGKPVMWPTSMELTEPTAVKAAKKCIASLADHDSNAPDEWFDADDDDDTSVLVPFDGCERFGFNGEGMLALLDDGDIPGKDTVPGSAAVKAEEPAAPVCEMPPAERHANTKRRFGFDPETRKFYKHECATPTMLTHQPVPEGRQLTLTSLLTRKQHASSSSASSSAGVVSNGYGDGSEQPSTKKARHFLSDLEKKYVHRIFESHGRLFCPDRASLESFIATGVADGSLTPHATYEGIRSYLRKLAADVEAVAVEDAKKLARAEKKREKNAATAATMGMGAN
jgi:hypothetical protein